MPKSHFGKRERLESKSKIKKTKSKDGRSKEKKDNENGDEAPAKLVDDSQQLFTKRLQKSQLKDLERELKTASQAGANTYAIQDQIHRVKKAVFTDEKRVDERKRGFEKAKVNVKKTALSEFM